MAGGGAGPIQLPALFDGGDDRLLPAKPLAEEARFDITAMIDLVFMMNIFFLVTTVAAALAELDLPPARHAVAAELDDAHAMVARKIQPRLWSRMLADALEYWRDDAATGSVFVLPLHAWVAGAANRFANLRRALADHPAEAFWQAHPHAIAQRWRASNAGERSA